MLRTVKFMGLAVVILISFIISIGFGSVEIPISEVINNIQFWAKQGVLPADSTSSVLWQIRVPRTLFAIFCGIGLAECGLVLQTITENDLSDPYVLGVSSGAGLGAVGAIIFGWFAFMGTYSQTFGAFLGALLAMLLVIGLAGKSNNVTRLVLIGVGVSALFSAVTMVMIYSSNHENQVRSAMFWLLGSFSGIQWKDLPLTVLAVTISLVTFYLLRNDLDILLLGEREAYHLGLSVKKLQIVIIVISSFCIAVLVANAGIIGFIGLITPHLARYLTKGKHSEIVPFTALISALFMIWADVAARSVFSPEELPIGILTSVVGAPLFIWIVYKKQKGVMIND